MTRKKYEEYCERFHSFMEADGIENLSSGHPWCEECGEEDGQRISSGNAQWDWDDDDKCPKCGTERELADEEWFSWRTCDCCLTSLGGSRVHATGYNREKDEIYHYTICTDCEYFAEYGKLDDHTMEEIESTP